MSNTLITVGIAFIAAALVGGGLKAFGVEIPVLRTRKKAWALGGVGAVMLVVGIRIVPKDELRLPKLEHSSWKGELHRDGMLPSGVREELWIDQEIRFGGDLGEGMEATVYWDTDRRRDQFKIDQLTTTKLVMVLNEPNPHGGNHAPVITTIEVSPAGTREQMKVRFLQNGMPFNSQSATLNRMAN
jgi:hypothetical protein